mmetsp:Transcript_7447/g.13461  ORF Transcript_7447/g.13461 Transcript_7447/m.13461 type:complete len:343 (-) Transcript_7447:1139-2167(-)
MWRIRNVHSGASRSSHVAPWFILCAIVVVCVILVRIGRRQSLVDDQNSARSATVSSDSAYLESQLPRWTMESLRESGFYPPQPSSSFPVGRKLSGQEILKLPFTSRLIVSEKLRLVYCPMPKVANSNWKYLIRKVEGLDDFDNLTLAHNAELSGLRYLSDYSPVDVESILFGDEELKQPPFFKFTFVRDPYTRLLSAYLDKFLNKDTSSEEYRLFVAQIYSWKYVRNKDLSSEPKPSFRAFIDELLKQNPSKMNLHWMPQTMVCGFGDLPYDFVGRFETLLSDASTVLDKIGVAGESFPTQEQIGFLPSGTNAMIDELYSLDIMLKIRVLYEMDFFMLNYRT